MRANPDISATQEVTLPNLPAVVVRASEAAILTTEGEVRTLSHDQARLILHKQPCFVCHAPYTRKRLGLEALYGYDVLELFAFVHPARFCVPTPHGLCKALGLSEPQDFEDMPFALVDITKALLLDLQKDIHREKADPLKIAEVMGLKGKGWAWTPYVFEALGETYAPETDIFTKSALNVWKHLPEWAEEAPEPPSSHHGVSADEAKERLGELLSRGDVSKEPRPQQQDYTAFVARAFDPPQDEDTPHMLLAEAGTGVGKTLGYLAPASLWAEKNEGSVWISTYTKNLQRQIDQELDRLYPHPQVKDAYVSVRKGRENYLCLLNMDEAAMRAALVHNPTHAVAAGIMARWTAATKDGDLSGPDFPGWLSGVLGYAYTYGLADRRGECIYAACDHYSRCFVERSQRKAKRARLVIANHALVMISSALSSPGEVMPGRYIFDEGHHLFDAADSAFAAHLTMRESVDLRRWLLGAEGRGASRARGLKRRVEDLIAGDDEGLHALEDVLHGASALASYGWGKRLQSGEPHGPAEGFLAEVYNQVLARADGRDGPYSLETALHPVASELITKSAALRKALLGIQKPMARLSKIMQEKLAEDTGDLDSDTRKRLDALSTSLERRGKMTLSAWVAMLETIEQQVEPTGEFVDWTEIERIDGRAVDVGVYRHFIDPMKPFAASVKPHLHGMAVTSATLRDEVTDAGESWQGAQERTGAFYLSRESEHSAFDSPFDYQANTRVFIASDVNKQDLGQVAGAYRALFEASGGGALGLFTAISRLRAVHEKIAGPLEHVGLPLYAQHIDEMDAGTLVDIFRDEEHACLLGTDAIRDGVDVPGSSLRLIAFDRVPWPRPTILHKARREAFGGRRYDEMMTRLKLKQAFGRLIRRSDDKGVFVMLDSMLPSRLQSAFPEEVEIQKTGLAEIVQEIKAFL